ncbi:MAG TPA: metallophosphoesterase, partial [Thermoanaerobaculia bacterium]|nr:metallophosphoesterase [Thermoanaerobaculia bacterium]
MVHLSDLHIAGETPLLRRLLRAVAAERPELVVVSGDLVEDTFEPEAMARHVRATAAAMAALRRTAPVMAVQGHSDHQGALIGAVAEAGVTWLSNEGRLVAGPPPGKAAGGLLLLGVNQQIGLDWGFPQHRSPFMPMRHEGGWRYGARTGARTRNEYSHYDPAPAAGLADAGGPLAWSGYDAVCDVWIERSKTGAGLAVHSRYPLGEDRMIRLRRADPVHDLPATFALAAHGTAFTAGRVDTGVEPEPGRWYRMRMRTAVEPRVVRVWAKVWPADAREPRDWQAWAEDRSSQRAEAGTVGLWSWGHGTVLYRDLRVTAASGRTLLADPFAGSGPPAGWRTGARGTRLAMALARSPRRP